MSGRLEDESLLRGLYQVRCSSVLTIFPPCACVCCVQNSDEVGRLIEERDALAIKNKALEVRMQQYNCSYHNNARNFRPSSRAHIR